MPAVIDTGEVNITVCHPDAVSPVNVADASRLPLIVRFTVEVNFNPNSTAPPAPASITVGAVLLLQIKHGHVGAGGGAANRLWGTKDNKIAARIERRNTCLAP